MRIRGRIGGEGPVVGFGAVDSNRTYKNESTHAGLCSLPRKSQGPFRVNLDELPQWIDRSLVDYVRSRGSMKHCVAPDQRRHPVRCRADIWDPNDLYTIGASAGLVPHGSAQLESTRSASFLDERTTDVPGRAGHKNLHGGAFKVGLQNGRS